MAEVITLLVNSPGAGLVAGLILGYSLHSNVVMPLQAYLHHREAMKRAKAEIIRIERVDRDQN